MSYTVTKLVTNAWYLSGIVARNLQVVTGDQMSDGLDLLNVSVLGVKSANTRLIPYFQEFDFNLVIGQEKYFIPNLIAIETMTFYIGTVRYSMLQQKRVQYWGSGRIDNINSLPFSWEIERTLGGSNVYIYFTPDQNYRSVIWGKFQLANVALNQDLLLTLDPFYIEYLRYALAEQMTVEYNIPFQPQNARRLAELENIILTISPPDLSMQKLTALGMETGVNYADVNIGRGWRP